MLLYVGVFVCCTCVFVQCSATVSAVSALVIIIIIISIITIVIDRQHGVMSGHGRLHAGFTV